MSEEQRGPEQPSCRSVGTAGGIRSVLIVDGSAEARDVLRAVLERRGMTILEATGPQQGREMLERHKPRVSVLDVEDLTEYDDQQQCDQFSDSAQRQRSSLVLLGTAAAESPDSATCVRKPYHYQTLIRTIEQLLDLPR